MISVYSYFASLKYEKPLEEMGLGLIGAIKQVTRKFPMEKMQRKYFTCRVNSYGLVSEYVNEVVLEMMEFSWVHSDGQREYIKEEGMY